MIKVITKVTVIVKGTEAEVDLGIDTVKEDPDQETVKEVPEITDHAVEAEVTAAETGEDLEAGVDPEKEVDTAETEVEVTVRPVTYHSHALHHWGVSQFPRPQWE